MSLREAILIAVEVILSWAIILSFISVLFPSLLGNYLVLSRRLWLIAVVIQVFFLGAVIKFLERDTLHIV